MLLSLRFFVFQSNNNPYLIGLHGGLIKVMNVKYEIAGLAQQKAALSDGLLPLTCQQGPFWPEEACQSPKGNWMALKAELIKCDFAAPAER